MDRPSTVRVCFVPKPRSNLSVSQTMSEPNFYGRRSSRVNPWTMSTISNDFSSSSSIQGIRDYNKFPSESSLNLLNNNDINKRTNEKSYTILKNIASKKAKHSLWCLIILIIFFAIISLGALAIGLYAILMIRDALSTTISTSTTTTTTTSTTTTAFSFVWNSSGTTVAGTTSSSGYGSTQLSTPFGLTIDASKALYVAEWTGNRVSKWPIGASSGTTVAGQASGISSTNLSALTYAGDVVLDSSGNLYVTDAGNHRVQFWLVGATSGVTVAGISGSSGLSNNQLYLPYSLARDSSTGTLYISDTGNQRVMRYYTGATSGTVVAGGNGFGFSGTQLYSPMGIYFDSSSNSLIIVNYGASNIVRWIIGAMSWTLIAGSPNGMSGTSSTQLYQPMGMTVDPMGNIYVADTINNRIQLFFAGQSNGTTILGSSAGAGPTQLFLPYSVILDDDLNLYVADTGNHRVQKYQRY